MVGRRTNISHNACLKVYKNGYTALTVSDYQIYNEAGFEKSEAFEKPPKSDSEKPADRERFDNIRRSVQKVFDIGMMNDFKYFVTWTLDGSKINRYDPIEVSKKVKIFLRNMVERHNLTYVILPEYHKNGGIHMHGLIKGDIKLVENERGLRMPDGRMIYNMPQWKYGFSTCIEIENGPEFVSKYITKYVVKDNKKIFGNFYYAGGKELIREPKKIVFDMPYNMINAKEYVVEGIGIGFKYVSNCSPELLKKYVEVI